MRTKKLYAIIALVLSIALLTSLSAYAIIPYFTQTLTCQTGVAIIGNAILYQTGTTTPYTQSNYASSFASFNTLSSQSATFDICNTGNAAEIIYPILQQDSSTNTWYLWQYQMIYQIPITTSPYWTPALIWTITINNVAQQWGVNCNYNLGIGQTATIKITETCVTLQQSFNLASVPLTIECISTS
jgi:hypothetical protein